VCLIGAYLAGAVKEIHDVKIFSKSQSKMRRAARQLKDGAGG